jgi:hypothetical protein
VSRTTTGIGSSRLTKASAVNSSILGVARAPKGLWDRRGDVFWSSFVSVSQVGVGFGNNPLFSSYAGLRWNWSTSAQHCDPSKQKETERGER